MRAPEKQILLPFPHSILLHASVSPLCTPPLLPHSSSGLWSLMLDLLLNTLRILHEYSQPNSPGGGN